MTAGSLSEASMQFKGPIKLVYVNFWTNGNVRCLKKRIEGSTKVQPTPVWMFYRWAGWSVAEWHTSCCVPGSSSSSSQFSSWSSHPLPHLCLKDNRKHILYLISWEDSRQRRFCLYLCPPTVPASWKIKKTKCKRVETVRRSEPDEVNLLWRSRADFLQHIGR